LDRKSNAPLTIGGYFMDMKHLIATLRNSMLPLIAAPFKSFTLHALPLIELAIGLPILWVLVANS
jgi:hypothetical protein